MTLYHRASRLPPKPLRILRTCAALATVAVLVVFGTVGYNFSPGYYWLMPAALAPALAYLYFRRAFTLAEAWVRAQKRWMADGLAVERVHHARFEKLRYAYCEHTRDDFQGYVDDRTWTDLGMDEIHDRADVCFTMAGRNELYRILRHSLPPEDRVEERLSQSAAFRDDVAHRERIASVLSAIGEERDADPASLLWGDAVKPDRLYPLFVAMALLAVASIFVIATFGPTIGLISVAGVFFVNMWIYFRKAKHISVYVPALRILSRMINASDGLPGMADLRQATTGTRGAFRWLLTGAPNPVPTTGQDLIEILLLYLKIFFLIDLIAHDRIVKHIVTNRGAYRALYQAIGSLDAVFALGSYRARRETTCDAGTTEGGEAQDDSPLELDGAYHPLIKDAVANSVKLKQPGAIVTGTNMAGKSTFLRTIGINVLFAQTAGFAFAVRYRTRRHRVLSSIEKHDDLATGKSFYYDEAERIYRMIEEVDTEIPALLLVDELLSGTNSLERESASVAILHYLSDRNALTIAATHDVTIAHGLEDRYALYYFTDSADENGLTFDYHIQQGVVKTRNAIKLLRLIGYPEDVIRAALERTEGP